MPADSTYVFGTLRMPQEADSVSKIIPSIWQADPLGSILVILSILCFLLSFSNLLNILPSILNSIFNFKSGIAIESSLQCSRARNWTAVLMILPFVLITDRFLPAEEDIVFFLALFFGYILVRHLLFRLLSYRLYSEDYFVFSSKSVGNYFIILCLLEIISLGIFSAFQVNPQLESRIIMTEIIATYTLCIARRFHILVFSHSGFSSFLYLCVLEFLPTGILLMLWLR